MDNFVGAFCRACGMLFSAARFERAVIDRPGCGADAIARWRFRRVHPGTLRRGVNNLKIGSIGSESRYYVASTREVCA